MKTLLLLAAVLAWGNPPKPAVVPERPEDLGPAVVDVSDYPAEHQETYRKIFLPVYSILPGGPARALNSGLIELDPQGEAVLRRDHPELFSDPRLAEVGPGVWRKEVMRVKNRPPCCGACPVLSMDDAKRLWRFFVYDSLRRKTGLQAPEWAAHRRALFEAYDKVVKDPEGSGRH